MTDLCICGHPKVTHRYQGGNQHSSFTYLSDCKAEDCDCPGFGMWVEAENGDTGGSGGEEVECTVCGDMIGRGPGGLGTAQHANKHRREFRERFDREPRSYDEVRARLGRPGYQAMADGQQLTLTEGADTRARDARNDDEQADLTDGGTE